MPDKLFRFSLVAIFYAVPFIARANMIWPSIYIVQQYYAWYIILTALLIEIIAAHFCLKTNWGKSALIMFVANAVSAILGLLLIPISGILIEVLTIPFGGGTFQLLHWILDYICVVLVNTAVEGLSLKWMFKYSFKANFRWLLLANLGSVVICIIVTMIS